MGCERNFVVCTEQCAELFNKRWQEIYFGSVPTGFYLLLLHGASAVNMPSQVFVQTLS